MNKYYTTYTCNSQFEDSNENNRTGNYTQWLCFRIFFTIRNIVYFKCVTANKLNTDFTAFRQHLFWVSIKSAVYLSENYSEANFSYADCFVYFRSGYCTLLRPFWWVEFLMHDCNPSLSSIIWIYFRIQILSNKGLELVCKSFYMFAWQM